MKIRFDVFSLFPDVMQEYFHSSMLEKARHNGLLDVNLHNIRDWAFDKHHVTDDEPYGGGGGMVMKPEPIFAAVEDVMGIDNPWPVILLTPQGRLFNQQIAVELADTSREVNARICLICGRYEGVDERVRKHLATDEISIGDYVITGGELAAQVVVDAVTRQIPGVLGDPKGASDDSHASGLLEHPHYTRPGEFRGWKVPDVLRSGDHARINEWRREQSLERTLVRRPELLNRANLTESDRKFLDSIDLDNT